ncbi:CpaE family protein [Pseudohalocynthiibacter aestuariivivens]|jgi:pilus assembly protein CpaE|uniref:CpaE family protein n=1 Tax=Pseudohalocynthiibacter aestuariivivens TaxID=1591409 RepID=A0ABV5JAR9_9RHOB|nr:MULTISPECIES: AAA family ATPase [Pseudohalocynthiibacter]MBS9715902.1 AAA family ATPase [Pseudohalocynthiibacter aestuariivivens]MCK0101515.1 AAA family ATPase [Pseudohalocynthiibacter sp. F2068]
MTSSAMLQTELAPIVACTISRDVQNFDLLIEDMEAELGESWGDLSFEDAAAFLKQPDAESLEFVAVAIDDQDEENLTEIGELIKTAKARDIKVILIAEEVSPIALHQLLRMGAHDFVPYPLPDGELHEAIERMRALGSEVNVPDEMKTKLKATGDKNGVVLPVHGLSGGTGATTFAVNLAWELANIDKEKSPRVCLIDFDLQFGTTSTYLDLPRREAVYELLSDTSAIDSDSFMQALLTFNEKLHVLTAPTEILPLDLIGPQDVDRLVEIARTNFDYVVIDMPSTLVSWTETVLSQAHVYFATLELDMRSAQNALRMVRALKSEELPFEKLRFILNRAPKFTDLSGKARVKRLAESLDIDIEIQLPDGGKPVAQAGDHGLPLAETVAKNPLRKEIQKLALSIHQLNEVAETGQ